MAQTLGNALFRALSTGKSFGDIAFRFGYTGHTIVTHANRVVKSQLDVKEPSHMRDYEACKEILDACFGKSKEASLR